ncbi:ABC1 kinase family protein [Rhizobium ruizarguesonis]
MGLLVDIIFSYVLVRLSIRSNEWRENFIADSVFTRIVHLSGLYIKFGQILASRPDILPLYLTKRLEELYDRVPPEPFHDSIATIVAELGKDTFSSKIVHFDTVPLAAASFSTVYAGRLLDGRRVVVKVQRRDVKRTVNIDLSCISFLARVIDSSGLTGRLRMLQFVQEFARWTSEELDYEREGQQIELIGKRSKSDNLLRVPVVEWGLTTRRILVMERFDGVWLTDKRALNQMLPDLRRDLAARTLEAVLFQIFEIGAFHADPHAGNICILTNGEIAFVDFGIMGFIDRRSSKNHARLLWAIKEENIDSAFEEVLQASVVPPDADVERFRQIFQRNVRSWQLLRCQPTVSAREKSASNLMLQNFHAARQCGIYLTSDVARYYRAIFLLESIAFTLDPTFDVPRELSEYFRKKFIREFERALKTQLDPLETAMHCIHHLDSLAERLDAFNPLSGSVASALNGSLSPGLLHISSFFKVLSVAIMGLLSLLLLDAWFGHALRFDFGNVEFGPEIGPAIIFAGVALSAVSGWMSRLFWIKAFKTSKPS